MTIPNESIVIAQAVQTIFQGMVKFAASSVVISNWTQYDQSETASPWVLIFWPGLVQGIDNTFGCDGNLWQIQVEISIPFNDRPEDLQELAELRDATLVEFTANRNLGIPGTVRASLQTIADLTPSFPYRPIYYADEPQDMPDLLALDMVFTISTQE